MLRDYISIARPDHWTKNVFVLPGIFLAFYFEPATRTQNVILPVFMALLACCLTASSNYVINEILDAPTDKFHPIKRNRPIPSGKVNMLTAWLMWFILALCGFACAYFVNMRTFFMVLLLWIMGIIYNVKPLRFKDKAYLDVFTESANNPIRLCIGWFSVGVEYSPTLSAIMAYWMFGGFLMAMKRFAEYRMINNAGQAAAYRASFKTYNTEKLMLSVIFYAASFGMFSGVFIARYCIEIILAAPLVAWTMAYYVHLGYKPMSAVQYPEYLVKEYKLMLILGLILCLGFILLFVRLPFLENFFLPQSLPPR